ncbi:MAG TPA: hypothetical protein VE734_02070, partial [Terriglobales bacterium]|nr:hypothetical protein [Terriglobales bacterium]
MSITLSPTAVSLNRGATAQVTAQALDSNNNVVAAPALAFQAATQCIPAMPCDTPPITVSNTGLICAGQWDASVPPIKCQATDNVGTATITATASVNGKIITSSAVVVTDHERIDSVRVASSGGTPDCPAPPANACVSQSDKAPFQLQAFSNDPAACQRINGSASTPCQLPADTVGSVNWSVSPAQVATADAAIHAMTDPVCVTAAAPGEGVVVGSVGPSGSAITGSAAFTTCPVASIHVHQKNTPTPPDTDTFFTAPVGSTVPLVADVVDSNGTSLSSTTALTWFTSQPALASVSLGTVGTIAPGFAEITAACLPPSCNVNFTPPK